MIMEVTNFIPGKYYHTSYLLTEIENIKLKDFKTIFEFIIIDENTNELLFEIIGPNPLYYIRPGWSGSGYYNFGGRYGWYEIPEKFYDEINAMKNVQVID